MKSSGGINLCRLCEIDPSRGAEFEENGPNLTEEFGFAIGTTLVGSAGPEDVHNSGIESKIGGRLEIISSWRRAAVEQALAKATDGSDDRGPDLNVNDKVAQSIVGLVSHNQGRPRTIEADGCRFITRRHRSWMELSAKTTDNFTDSWMNPAVAGLPSNRHRVIGRSNGSKTKLG